jgi:hypothetical protein
VSSLSLRKEVWKEVRKSSRSRLERKCFMAEWARGGAGGRGGRGRGWRPRGYFPDQQFPPPYNPFFYPGFGFESFLQQGAQYHPPGVRSREGRRRIRGTSTNISRDQKQIWGSSSSQSIKVSSLISMLKELWGPEPCGWD